MADIAQHSGTILQATQAAPARNVGTWFDLRIGDHAAGHSKLTLWFQVASNLRPHVRDYWALIKCVPDSSPGHAITSSFDLNR